MPGSPRTTSPARTPSTEAQLAQRVAQQRVVTHAIDPFAVQRLNDRIKLDNRMVLQVRLLMDDANRYSEPAH